MLFMLYTMEIQDIVKSFGLDSHVYVDDTHNYFYCAPHDVEQIMPRLLSCIEAFNGWMSSNRLKLNPDKSELIWFASSHQLKNITQSAMMIGSYDVISVFFCFWITR